MIKTSSKVSITVSMILAGIFFALCVAGMFILPWLTQVLIDLPDNIGNRGAITDIERGIVLALAYAILVTVMAIVALMFVLLLRIRAGQVFTTGSVLIIRAVSYGCMLLCAVFCGLGLYFQLAFAVAFAALFLGLCLRVVKNVLEEATRIKLENDMTV